MTKRVTYLAALAGAAAISIGSWAQATGQSGTTDSGDAEAVTVTAEFLADPAQIEMGKGLWSKQCRHCHGRNAYPGKAPKLKPRRYTADFVYDRITNGFRKMPSWRAVFNRAERMAIVTFVKSKKFSP